MRRHVLGLVVYLVHAKFFLVNVHLPKDRISMAHQGFGFCEFLTEEDAEYACKIMNQIKLWGKPIRVNKVGAPLLTGASLNLRHPFFPPY